jgi:Virulence-associated protein E/RepB DNA-primase from phage plasmid
VADLVPDFDAAVEFLGTLFPGGPWTVVAIEPEPPSGERPRAPGATFDDPRALRAWLERHSRWNLYYAVARAPAAKTTPHREDLSELLALHVDLDLPKGGRPTEAAFAELLARLDAVRPEPSAVVFSGGGYQALWLLDAPIRATEASIAAIEEANRAVATSLGADHCHNANRLMRLPGTVNRLSATKVARGRSPALAYLVSADPTRVLAFGVDPVPRPLPSDGADPDDEPYASGGPTVEPLGDDEPSIADLPLRLRRTIEKGDAASWGGDRSRMIFYVVCSLVRRGWSDAAISSVLLDVRYGTFTAHVREQGDPARYASKQVASARAKIASDWHRTNSGSIDPGSRENVLRALSEIGARFGRNEFSGRDYVNGAGPLRQVDDDAMVDIRFAVDAACGFLPARDLLADATRFLAMRSRFHPVLRRLDSLAWDGTDRLETWLIRAAGAEDSEYVRAVSKLTLIGGINRLRVPGCKFDQMVVFIDPQQGTGKSSAVQILALELDWFTDSVPIGAPPKQVIERLAGKWIAESSDLAGMSRRDVNELKAFLSQRSDLDRLSYDHYATDVPRHTIFFGTTNSEVFLKDDQNRRFWPVRTSEFDLDWLRANVEQLWAEADARFRAGETPELPEELWGVAAEKQADVRAYEPWVELFDEAFGDLEGYVVNRDVYVVLDKPEHHRVPEDDARIARSMRELGFLRQRRWAAGRTRIVYERWTKPGRAPPIFVHRDPLTRALSVSYSIDPETAFGLAGDPTHPPPPSDLALSPLADRPDLDHRDVGFVPGDDPPF